MNIIFLDVDGVLNNDKTDTRTPSGFIGIDDILINKLSQIVKQTDAVVVLTSTWKEEWDKNPEASGPDGKYLFDKLKQQGIHIIDKVNDEPHGSYRRGTSVYNYLQQHKEIEHYVILDDFAFNYKEVSNLNEHFIHTSELDGLTDQNINDAINILNNPR